MTSKNPLGIFDALLEWTGTGPYAVEAIKQRDMPQVPNRAAKGRRLPVSQSGKRIPKEGRRLMDYLDSRKR